MRRLSVKSPVTVAARPFRDLHLEAVYATVPHNVSAAVTVDAPEAPFCVDIPGESVIIQTINLLPGTSGYHGRPVHIAGVMLKQSLIIGAHMVVIVAVETLKVRDPGCKCVPDRVSRPGSIDSRVAPLIKTLVIVQHMTGGAAGRPVKSMSLRSFSMDMTPETPPSQKVIYQHGRGFSMDFRLRRRQWLEGSA